MIGPVETPGRFEKHEWPKVVNSSFTKSTDRNLSGLFLQVHICAWENWLLGKFPNLCPQRMMNFWVEKLLLLGIDKTYENGAILQIMIRINTINLAGDDILKHVDVSLPPSSIVLADAGGIYHFRFRYKTFYRYNPVYHGHFSRQCLPRGCQAAT